MMENDVKTEIAETAAKLATNYTEQKLFDLSLGERLPSKDAIIEFVEELRKITFPGFFGRENMAYSNKEYFAGHELSIIYEKLFKQIKIALRYGADDRSYDMATGDGGNDDRAYEKLNREAQEKALAFIEKIPEVQAMLFKDVQAEYDGDPAANSKEEIIFSYPGLFAIFVFRYAHVLYEMKVPFIPRIMTEYAHSQTGIDINPGANIGEYFFIDHGTGIVIGETTDIGNNVKIYQGVTLGALSTKEGHNLSGVKRHPTVEDNVVIYANTTILGGETVIGRNSTVAGNTFVLKSIPANTKAASVIPELEIKSNSHK